jgi:hypothetical protein
LYRVRRDRRHGVRLAAVAGARETSVMRVAASLAVVLALASGCYARGHAHVRFNSPALRAIGTAAQVATAVAATAAAVHTAAVILSTPPPAPVDVYWESRPGFVWIHGRHTWNGNGYVWTPGYYEPARANQIYVEGYWTQQGGGYAWVDGQWTTPRPGYVYTEGYWHQHGGGYAWVPGQWQPERAGQVWVAGGWANHGGQRVYNPGRWSASASVNVRIR